MSDMPKGCVLLGGTSGIGRQVAKRLSQQGVPILFTYYGSSDAAREIHAELRGRASSIRADITQRGDLENVLRVAHERLPALDLVVNAVGLSSSNSLAAINHATWRAITDVNLFGVLLSAQIFGACMTQSGGGAIVNISSVAGIRPLPRGHDYVAAKSAIAGLTRSLALDLAPTVVVNAIAPGWISTERRPRSAATDKEMLSRIPLNRFGTADDVAGAVIFLGSAGRYITGQTILVDGGYSL